MKHCIRKTLGVNAAPGHKYKGGCFHIKLENGSWVQFGFGDPKSSRPDTEAQAYDKAVAYCDEHGADIAH